MKKMSKKEKIYIIVCLLLMVLSVSSYFILTSICDKVLEETQKKLDETIEKYGVVEKETIENIVGKFNTEVLSKENLNVASNDYLTKEEDNTYWYGLEQGLYLMFEPIEYKGDKAKEITKYMILYVDNNYTNHTQNDGYIDNEIGNDTVIGDRLVVDISEESIDAIATALSGYNGQKAFQYEVAVANGETYIIDTECENFLVDNLVIIYSGAYNTPTLTYTSEEDYGLYLKSDGSTIQFSNFNMRSTFARYSGQGVFSTNNEDSFGGGSSFDISKILYANRNLIDTISGDLIYKTDAPQSFTISFNTGFEDLLVESVSSNSFVLPVVKYDGFCFEGWYFDIDYTLPYSVGYEFYQDTVLYAKWKAYKTVSFVTGIEDYILDSVQVLEGEPYTVPAFSYAGYEFGGAFVDEALQQQFVDGTVITEDITMYLWFEPLVYDIGALLTQQVELTKGLQVIQSQLWIVLVVGLLYFVYRLFRIFF